MKKLMLLLATTTVFAVIAASAAQAGSEVCGPDCWGDLGGGWYSLPWTTDPVILNDDDGDNASSICAGKGGVSSVEFVYRGGQTLAIVTCGDGSVHTVETGRSTSSADPGGGDGNPNHDYEDGPPPSDPYGDQGGTQYTQCPGADDPAYDPNNEACW